MTTHAGNSDKPLDPLNLSPDALARVLSQVSGERVSADQIRKDLSEGAPVNEDGNVNLINYAAWLVKASK